jgi:hypothetical protein
MCLAFGLLVFGVVFFGVISVRIIAQNRRLKEKARHEIACVSGLLAYFAVSVFLSQLVMP